MRDDPKIGLTDPSNNIRNFVVMNMVHLHYTLISCDLIQYIQSLNGCKLHSGYLQNHRNPQGKNSSSGGTHIKKMFSQSKNKAKIFF